MTVGTSAVTLNEERTAVDLVSDLETGSMATVDSIDRRQSNLFCCVREKVRRNEEEESSRSSVMFALQVETRGNTSTCVCTANKFKKSCSLDLPSSTLLTASVSGFEY